MSKNEDDLSVYLWLPVTDIDTSYRFYVDTLGIFRPVHNARIYTTATPHLIVDFEQNAEPIPIKYGLRFQQITIIRRLKEMNVPHQTTENLSGVSVTITDPSGHQIWITSSTGEVT